MRKVVATDFSTVTCPRGNVTIYRMNGAQYVTELERPGSTVTTYEREAGTNQLTAIEDPLSRRTEFTYDSMGNVVTITDPENNTTTFTYTRPTIGWPRSPMR